VILTVEVNKVEEGEMEKILNKRKVRGVMKYLVYWKGFMVENDIWKKEDVMATTRHKVQ